MDAGIVHFTAVSEMAVIDRQVRGKCWVWTCWDMVITSEEEEVPKPVPKSVMTVGAVLEHFAVTFIIEIGHPVMDVMVSGGLLFTRGIRDSPDLVFLVTTRTFQLPVRTLQTAVNAVVGKVLL